MEANTIAEFMANVRFVGLEPEPGAPGEATAYMIAYGKDVEVGIPTGPRGEKGMDGAVAPALIWQEPVGAPGELPNYMSEADAGKAWIVGGKDLVYWNGNGFVTVSDVLIPGPEGKRGPQGNRGERGERGTQGVRGPAAAIEMAEDYVSERASQPGDILVKGEDGWGPGRIAERTYILPGSMMKHPNVPPIVGTSRGTLATLQLPPMDTEYTLEISGAVVADHGIASRVAVEVRIGDDRTGQQVGYGFGKEGGTGIHTVPVYTDFGSMASPDNRVGVFPAGQAQTLVLVAVRSGLVDGWSTKPGGTSVTIKMIPR